MELHLLTERVLGNQKHGCVLSVSYRCEWICTGVNRNSVYIPASLFYFLDQPSCLKGAEIFQLKGNGSFCVSASGLLCCPLLVEVRRVKAGLLAQKQTLTKCVALLLLMFSCHRQRGCNSTPPVCFMAISIMFLTNDSAFLEDNLCLASAGICPRPAVFFPEVNLYKSMGVNLWRRLCARLGYGGTLPPLVTEHPSSAQWRLNREVTPPIPCNPITPDPPPSIPSLVLVFSLRQLAQERRFCSSEMKWNHMNKRTSQICECSLSLVQTWNEPVADMSCCMRKSIWRPRHPSCNFNSRGRAKWGLCQWYKVQAARVQIISERRFHAVGLRAGGGGWISPGTAPVFNNTLSYNLSGHGQVWRCACNRTELVEVKLISDRLRERRKNKRKEEECELSMYVFLGLNPGGFPSDDLTNQSDTGQVHALLLEEAATGESHKMIYMTKK